MTTHKYPAPRSNPNAAGLGSFTLSGKKLGLHALYSVDVQKTKYQANLIFLKTLCKKWGRGAGVLALLTTAASAQGILTATPGRTVSTTAGTGTVGYTGDNAAATSATLASPSAVAYDAAGNLYLADAANHVIRKVSTTGAITTVAGTGIEGFGGDNGPATAAFLDMPTGLAVDTAGNLYIADSHNHRIREVSTNGTITTIAGTGIAGFSGDGAAATAAQLADPQAVAVDSAGNVYIADTNNQRIRKITAGTITTIAGDGEELFSGDGATATAAVLDTPTGVAVDAAGNVYIADRHNQRVREIIGTTISTIAGSGASSFAGGFGGDGASATAAALAKPTGVSVDAAGNVYIADTGNQRIRELGGGAITTILGSGSQGFGGDGSSPASANLNMPKSVAPDAVGNLSVADKLNERIRADALPLLTFAATPYGTLSAAQAVTLANTGTAAITVSSINFTGAYVVAPGGTCSAAPITLAASASCIEDIAFQPATVGANAGSVAFGGTGVVPQSVLLAGTGSIAATQVTVTSSYALPFVNQTIMLTATVSTAGIYAPSGAGNTVTFYANGVALAAPVTVGTAGIAILTTAFPVAGSYAITATYSGSTNFGASTSAPLQQLTEDFTLATNQPNPQSVIPGKSVTYNLTATPVAVPFTYPIVFSTDPLPPGVTATFTPTTVTPGTNPSNFTVTFSTTFFKTSTTPGPLHRSRIVGGSIGIAFLLLPFGIRLRRRMRSMRGLTLACLLVIFAGATMGLTGCGTESGFFGQPQKTYSINIYGTSTNSASATLQRVTTVTLTIE